MDVLAKLKSLFKSKGPRVDLEKRFHTLARVGQGSMSKLFRARDLMTGRTVALKVLDMVQMTRQMQRMKRAYSGIAPPSEGEVSVVLRHANIVHTYEHGVSTKGEQFLVMEFIEGVGLNFLVETKSASLTGKRINYLIQAAEGLAYVHEQKYLHRDICPRNLMVTPEGVVKMIDFGLAVPIRPEFQRPGNRSGTANYMAPELIKRETTDERIDIFAFGVSAYECLTGKFPWDAPDTTQMMVQHMNMPPRDPREIQPNMDAELAKLLMHTIAPSPKKRMGSMKELTEALRALKRQNY
jgi:serine/threonine protein kinase